MTTHAYFLSLDVDILNRYEVIVDEDILMTVFKNTSSVHFSDLEWYLQQDFISPEQKRRIHSLMALPDKSVCKTGLGVLPPVCLEKMYENDDYGSSPIPDFMASDMCYIDTENQVIYFYWAKKFPEVKMTVVSATMEEKLYQDYCRGRRVWYREVPTVKYRGRLIQYTAYSMSRVCIKAKGYKNIEQSIRTITGNPDICEITFKMFDESRDIYFGKTEGFNEYQGKDLVVLGTPHQVEIIYKLIGKYLGYEANEHLGTKKIEYNGYSFQIVTYSNEDMRNLQLYFIKSELEQAVGRARLLRKDCTVYLFSNLPFRQAEIIQE